MSKDTIYREDAIKAVSKVDDYGDGIGFEVRSHCLVELELVPSADRSQEVIAQVTFDEEKLREIVKEAVERFKEEYEIVDRPQGEWIDEAGKYDASFGIHDYRCSNCNSYADEYIGGHEWYTAGKPNFCPYCGADMRERKEKE